MSKSLPRLITVLALVLILAPSLVRAAGPDIPPALAPWVGFALHEAGQRLCPPVGNRPEARVCRFPTSLSLDVWPTGADMTYTVRLFDDGPAPLPHAAGAWIEGVREGGAALPVLGAPDAPFVRLPAGEHVLTGRLGWAAVPQGLALPPDVGLVRLSRQGAASPVVVSPAGELRLSPPQAAKAAPNRETVRVFRLVADGVPVTVTTLYRLEVSGLARSVTLAGAVPAGSVPLAVRAPVPASLGPDGGLVLDAGPGRYEVEVVARYPAKVDRIGPAACPYGREIWSFKSGEVREVRPEGLPGIDPKTADVPGPWQAYPAFAAEAGGVLALAELGRGAPTGRDALTLNREMWLDFSGQGLSVRDTVTGENRRGWTLSLLPPGELGRVTISGQDQPVVRLGQNGTPGVELRQSHLNLTARSRYPAVGAALPAGGFDREFERVSATLNLPPGWALAYATGPDTVTGGLLSGWTLLDLFLVFVLAVAAFTLRGRLAGAALGLFLLLSWHEPHAPTTVWMFVLAGLGLLRAAGDVGRLAGYPAFRRLSVTLFVLAMVSLVVLAVPFVARELRLAVAPQIGGGGGPPVPVAAMRQAANEAAPAEPAVAPAPAMPAAPARAKGSSGSSRAMALYGAYDADKAPERLEFDPNALMQTGPAMPSWHFASVGLSWRGPVAPGETLRLTLLPPLATAILGFARVILLGLALALLFDRQRVQRLTRPAAVAGAAAVLAAVLSLGLPGRAVAADFPPRDLLDALRDRLTQPPRCLPDCLGAPGLEVRLESGTLTIVASIDAAARVVAPLPAVSEGWRPTLLTLDGKPAGGLVRLDGQPAVLLEPGVHTVAMAGPAPEAVSFTVSAPLAPGRVQASAPGYRVRGLDERGGLAGPLEFVRAETGGKAQAAKPGATGIDVPAFFEVRRAVDFGLTFEVATEVVRRSPATGPAVAVVPLLAGELPDVAGVSVEGGKATVRFAAGQDRVSWRSRLPAAPSLALAAPADASLVETWTVTAAALYDVSYAGPPPVAWLTPEGRLAPRFTPWPGESLTVSVARPETAPGEFLTLERGNMSVRQGGQYREATLVLVFRAAKGARQAVKLPTGAEVTRLAVAGREALPTGGPDEVGFALPPGVTEVTVNFREKLGLATFTRTPAIGLGLPGANLAVSLELPADRWLLAVSGDTPLAPAVLYWGWLAAVAALGLGLSFVPDTPLSRLSWLLYALGLSQATPGDALLAVAWIAALAWRRRHPIAQGAVAFNIVQALLVLLTLAGLEALYETLGTGLLGLPRMQVAGNGSTATALRWTFDRLAGALPSCTAVSLPMAAFRAVMLAWAVWLAWSLVKWLRWGFDSLTTGGGWRKPELKLRLPGLGRGGPEKPEGLKTPGEKSS
ncbi:MAG: hypothetical protein B193_3923 [Solidesulfovibrio magneticus str. Maddingley MBC34]|uniref:Uncharacterized protein n=1 Tax=Solidesulfovibrio magneticus str. Maddingley MBC34 TaxID=1206767 RepID=K6FFJ7_9BACT|nr:MAG: hypothetical protein B193_3923 [Solidesulfovibrio magneticus str. Maddingley MBC34]